MTTATVHLHWLYHRGPEALRGVRLATSMCGVGGLLRSDVTAFREDATCVTCLKAADADTRTGSQCRREEVKR